jgi:hypothetical protein
MRLQDDRPDLELFLTPKAGSRIFPRGLLETNDPKADKALLKRGLGALNTSSFKLLEISVTAVPSSRVGNVVRGSHPQSVEIGRIHASRQQGA